MRPDSVGLFVSKPQQIDRSIAQAEARSSGQGQHVSEEPSRVALRPEEQQRKIDQAVERLNKMADVFAVSLRFSVHEATGTIMVRQVDSDGHVLREIPPERILDGVAKMQELMGVLFDAKA